MATYSNNTTIKVGNTVSIYHSGGNNLQTYTVPAGSMLEASSITVGGVGPNARGFFRVTYPGAPEQTILAPGYGASATIEKIKYPAGSILEFEAERFFSDNASYQLIGFLSTNTP